MSVDMSSKAIEARLRRVSQLRRLCLSLAKAGAEAEQVRKAADSCRSARGTRG
jgi:hypothetical protein